MALTLTHFNSLKVKLNLCNINFWFQHPLLWSTQANVVLRFYLENISSWLHGNYSQMIFLINPNEERFWGIMINSSTFRPEVISICSLEKNYTMKMGKIINVFKFFQLDLSSGSGSRIGLQKIMRSINLKKLFFWLEIFSDRMHLMESNKFLYWRKSSTYGKYGR